MALQRDITQVDFHFRSHMTTRQKNRRGVESRVEPRGGAEKAGAGPKERREGARLLVGVGQGRKRSARAAGRTMFVGYEDPEVERRRQLTNFINEELDVIDEAFKLHKYEDCLHKAEVCLRAVTTLPDNDIKKSETMASLHSCIGNACIALQQYDAAFTHHHTALDIGEGENNNAIIARSLGHMGRMYIIQGQFNKALQVFARKAPMCISLEEVTQTFHEIGNCFLVLGHYDYARDCGKKSLRAAKDSGLTFFEQQAWILIAIAQAKLNQLKEAYKAFNGALTVAINKKDSDSEKAIRGAMDHLSRKIESMVQKKALVNQRMVLRTQGKALLADDLPRHPAARAVGPKRRPMPPLSRHTATLTRDKPADPASCLTNDAAADQTAARTNPQPADRAAPRQEEPGGKVRRGTGVTAQGVCVTEHDDDNLDQDWAADNDEKLTQPRDGITPVDRQQPIVDGSAGAAKPNEEKVEVKEGSERVAEEKALHDAQTVEAASVGLESLRLALNQPQEQLQKGERLALEDERLAQTERRAREVRLVPGERLVLTERSERDLERRRFRREATVGSISIDDTTYQQFAREPSFNRVSTLRARQIYGSRQATSRQSMASRQSIASRQSMASRQKTKGKGEKARGSGGPAPPNADRELGDGGSEPELSPSCKPLPPITPRGSVSSRTRHAVNPADSRLGREDSILEHSTVTSLSNGGQIDVDNDHIYNSETPMDTKYDNSRQTHNDLSNDSAVEAAAHSTVPGGTFTVVSGYSIAEPTVAVPGEHCRVKGIGSRLADNDDPHSTARSEGEGQQEDKIPLPVTGQPAASVVASSQRDDNAAEQEEDQKANADGDSNTGTELGDLSAGTVHHKTQQHDTMATHSNGIEHVQSARVLVQHTGLAGTQSDMHDEDPTADIRHERHSKASNSETDAEVHKLDHEEEVHTQDYRGEEHVQNHQEMDTQNHQEMDTQNHQEMDTQNHKEEENAQDQPEEVFAMVNSEETHAQDHEGEAFTQDLKKNENTQEQQEVMLTQDHQAEACTNDPRAEVFARNYQKETLTQDLQEGRNTDHPGEIASMRQEESLVDEDPPVLTNGAEETKPATEEHARVKYLSEARREASQFDQIEEEDVTTLWDKGDVEESGVQEAGGPGKEDREETMGNAERAASVSKEGTERRSANTCQPQDDFPSRSQTVTSWVEAC